MLNLNKISPPSGSVEKKDPSLVGKGTKVGIILIHIKGLKYEDLNKC